MKRQIDWYLLDDDSIVVGIKIPKQQDPNSWQKETMQVMAEMKSLYYDMEINTNG